MENEKVCENLKHFEVLNALNVNDKTEKKSNGSTELTYLSWAWAWAEVKKLYPSANYDIIKFGEEKLPYVYDEKTGYMVFTRVEIEGIEHEMWLPVMDYANKAMKNETYNYQIKAWDKVNKKWQVVTKTVQPATMFDINKTIMRCLTKNLAMFGLGLYIYAGEDLPENIDIEEKVDKDSIETQNNTEKETIMIQDSQKKLIKDNFKADEIKSYLKKVDKSKLSELTLVEASSLIKTATDKGEKE